MTTSLLECPGIVPATTKTSKSRGLWTFTSLKTQYSVLQRTAKPPWCTPFTAVLLFLVIISTPSVSLSSSASNLLFPPNHVSVTTARLASFSSIQSSKLWSLGHIDLAFVFIIVNFITSSMVLPLFFSRFLFFFFSVVGVPVLGRS